MAQSSEVVVTLAEIARLADVGRAAVSNWRRRHGSFPTPVGGTDVSPQFSLAEVEAWLRGQGKLGEISDVERLWPSLEHLGDLGQAGQVIAAIALRRARSAPHLVSVPELSLRTDTEPLAHRALAVAEAEETAGETFEYLLGRWLDVHVRQISTTPRPLAKMIATLAVETRLGEMLSPVTVFDPACGSGTLLIAAAAALNVGEVRLVGTELDPVLSALAAARLATELAAGANANDIVVDIATGDSLLADPHSDVAADFVVCNPPFNSRDWGHNVLATDPRWSFGLPPRSESELAWVQHVLARTAPGGAAVVVMPPATASRKAGRHIRGALVRSGALRAVIALPAGLAPPHSVALHLWVLRRPDAVASDAREVSLVDASAIERPVTGDDWDTLTNAVLAGISSQQATPEQAVGAVRHRRVAAVDLLSEDVDLTPARHILSNVNGVVPQSITTSWSEFGKALATIADAQRMLSTLGWTASPQVGTTTIGELVRAGAVDLHAGQALNADWTHLRPQADTDLPLLTVSDLMGDGIPRQWIAPTTVQSGALTVTEPGDVVVAGVTRAFTAWVADEVATALGPQLYALRADTDRLDPWFLAGCLRAPSNGRQAGTHTSSSARIDVRKLRVLQLPIDEQRRYGAVFRRVSEFEHSLATLSGMGESLTAELSDRLASGVLDH
ncbi:N-6 DNA methylase [Nocardia sp. NPDC101769]|uniref:N-6 DNA methylase n=1 Tax=Nocardia sp. NPDC101769 TaxID=3364333 RepID=UPI00380BE11E